MFDRNSCFGEVLLQEESNDSEESNSERGNDAAGRGGGRRRVRRRSADISRLRNRVLNVGRSSGGPVGNHLFPDLITSLTDDTLSDTTTSVTIVGSTTATDVLTSVEDQTTAEDAVLTRELRMVDLEDSRGIRREKDRVVEKLVKSASGVDNGNTTHVTLVARLLRRKSVRVVQGVPVTTSRHASSLIGEITPLVNVHGASALIAETARNVGNASANQNRGSRSLTEPDGTADISVGSIGRSTNDAANSGDGVGGRVGKVASGSRSGGGHSDNTTSNTSTIESAGTVARISSGVDQETKTDGRALRIGDVTNGGVTSRDLSPCEGLSLIDETIIANVPVTEATSTETREGVGLGASKGGVTSTDPVRTKGLVSRLKTIDVGESTHVSKLMKVNTKTSGETSGDTANIDGHGSSGSGSREYGSTRDSRVSLRGNNADQTPILSRGNGCQREKRKNQ